MAKLYGHRGASALLPENTMAAFQLAIDSGADALETDVRLTRDGVVVVVHDADGRRMANTAAAVSDCTLDELREWDIGWGFVDADGERPHAGAGHAMPTLAELLDAFPDLPVNVDIKQSRPSMVEVVVDLLRGRDDDDRVLLASFDTATLRRVRALDYGGPTGMSRNEVARLAALPGALLERFGVPGDRAQVPVSALGYRFGSRGFIDKCHRLGKPVDFWTVDDAALAEELVLLGADGVMSNDPAAVRSAVRGPPCRTTLP